MMKMHLKLASAVAAVVGLSFSMPLFAAANPCAGLKGEAASKCRKEQREADIKAGKGGAPGGSSEVAGGGAGKATPARAARTGDPSGAKAPVPKGASETAGGGAGKDTPARAARTGDPSGAKGGAPATAGETAGGPAKK